MAQAGSRDAGAQSTPAAAQTQDPSATPATSADAARVKELEAQVAQLQGQTADAGRAKELEAENARLREQLADAGRSAGPARPHEPSFTFSASMATELETTGRTVSPFTGTRYVGTSADDAREATVEEFNNAKPPAKADAEKTSGRKPAAGRRR